VTDTQRQLLPREERRAQILHAAARAFADGGFAATSMDDVAAAAGVTKLIVYRHFESKEELYGAVLDSVSARMADGWRAAAGQVPLVRGATVRAFLQVAREDPHGYRLLVFHAPREAQFEKQAFGYWEMAVAGTDGLIGQWVKEPAVREWVVHSVMGYLLHSVLIWLQTGDPADDEAFIDQASAGMHALVETWTALPPIETIAGPLGLSSEG
jgi:AcrR family transcriptional regulator